MVYAVDWGVNPVINPSEDIPQVLHFVCCKSGLELFLETTCIAFLLVEKNITVASLTVSSLDYVIKFTGILFEIKL